jgi:hypothetical protein
MNIFITGSFCSLYKCAGIGIYSDTPFVTGALRADIVPHCNSSNLADANALFHTLNMIKHFDKKTVRAFKKCHIHLSDIAVVKRALKEIDLMHQSNYYRPDPWNRVSQLLRDIHDIGLMRRIRIVHCDRDNEIMKLAIKQAKSNLKAARKYVLLSLHDEKENQTEERVPVSD